MSTEQNQPNCTYTDSLDKYAETGNHTTEIEDLRHEVAECKSRLFTALVALRDLRDYVPPRDWLYYWERVLVTNTNYVAEVLDLVNKKKLDRPPAAASGQ